MANKQVFHESYRNFALDTTVLHIEIPNELVHGFEEEYEKLYNETIEIILGDSDVVSKLDYISFMLRVLTVIKGTQNGTIK